MTLKNLNFMFGKLEIGEEWTVTHPVCIRVWFFQKNAKCVFVFLITPIKDAHQTREYVIILLGKNFLYSVKWDDAA